MTAEIIEMGSISSRGQIAIPSSIRKELDLAEGTKILFTLEDDTILMRKVNKESFRDLIYKYV